MQFELSTRWVSSNEGRALIRDSRDAPALGRGKRVFQRLGPRAEGGAKRGTGGCRSSDVVMVRRFVGTDWPLARG